MEGLAETSALLESLEGEELKSPLVGPRPPARPARAACAACRAPTACTACSAGAGNILTPLPGQGRDCCALGSPPPPFCRPEQAGRSAPGRAGRERPAGRRPGQPPPPPPPGQAGRRAAAAAAAGGAPAQRSCTRRSLRRRPQECGPDGSTRWAFLFRPEPLVKDGTALALEADFAGEFENEWRARGRVSGRVAGVARRAGGRAGCGFHRPRWHALLRD